MGRGEGKVDRRGVGSARGWVGGGGHSPRYSLLPTEGGVTLRKKERGKKKKDRNSRGGNNISFSALLLVEEETVE